MRFARVPILVLAIVTCCVVSCAAAWIYQVWCSFEAGTKSRTVVAGEIVQFLLWQSDCLASVFGHACYLEPEVTVEGLPAGSEVIGVEYLDCHQAGLNIATQPATEPGVYLLTIRRQDGIAFPLKVTLEVVVP